MSKNEGDDVPPRWVATAWAPADSARSDADNGLNADKIIGAAIELADEEGLAGLSIRKLAGRLGAGTMTAYRHIESRDDLIVLMVDRALGVPPEDAVNASDWRAGVRAWTAAIATSYTTHPWLVDAPISGFIATPNRALWLEYILQTLHGAGLGMQQMLDAALLIDGHARNVASMRRALAVEGDGAGGQSTAGQPAPGWLASLLTPERFPLLSRVIMTEALSDGSGREVDTGLDRIIDGIAVLSEQ